MAGAGTVGMAGVGTNLVMPGVILTMVGVITAGATIMAGVEDTLITTAMPGVITMDTGTVITMDTGTVIMETATTMAGATVGTITTMEIIAGSILVTAKT